jgi:hypothetical protein
MGTHRVRNEIVEGEFMFQATEKAVEKIKEYLKDQNVESKIRILLSGGG